jgi:hypothetical protein
MTITGPFALRTNEASPMMKLKLLDITNWLSIRIMYQLRNVVPSVLRTGEALYRMRPRLLDTSNLLPIRMTHHPKTAMPFSM